MRLSVVVPCHDAARFLPTTLTSAQRNTSADTEWLLVDDGSRDGTAALLAAFAPLTGSVRVLTHPESRGVAAARNTGTAAATGRFVTYLDADDWFAPGYLPQLTNAIERLGVDFVRADHVRAEGRTRTIRRAPESRRWEPLPAHRGIGTGTTGAGMVDYPNAWSGVYDLRLRDRGLLHVEEHLATAEDRRMSWRLHLFATSYAVVGLTGYFYRQQVRDSLTAIGDARQLHFFDAYDLVLADLLAHAELAPHLGRFVGAYLRLIAHHDAHRSRFTGDSWAMFRGRARHTIGSLPADLVADALRSIAPARARRLRRLA